MTTAEQAVPAPPSAVTPLHRRPSTWLLAGWCVLVPLMLLARMFGLHGCPAGQYDCDRAPTLPDSGPWWVLFVAGALALAGLCVVEARRPAVVSAPVSPRVHRRRWLVVGSALGVLAGAHLVLLGPMVDDPFCAKPVHINGFMAYPFNCDSEEFTRLAHDPGAILEYHNERQSRPGYVAVAATGTYTVGQVAHWLHLDRLYGQNDTAYIPLVLINMTATAAAIALLAWLLSRLGTPTAVTVALGGLLAVNEVTKAFTWTAHQQTFALLVPLATIVAARWLILDKPSWRPVALLGLGFGLASLIYGSFLITAGVVFVVLLARRRRGLLPIAAFAAGFAVLQVAWIAVCRIVTGTYYNHEAQEYDEFVWPLVAYERGGLRAVWSASRDMTLTTIRELSVTHLALVLVAVLVAVAVLLRVRLAAGSPEEKATLVAAGLTLVFAVLFAWGIGIIAHRLMFHALPALFVVVGWLAARVTAGSPLAARAVGPGLLAVAAVVMTTTVAAHGPYS